MTHLTIVLKRNGSFNNIPDWPNELPTDVYTAFVQADNVLDAVELAKVEARDKDRQSVPPRLAKEITTEYYTYLLAFPGRQYPIHYGWQGGNK